MNVELTKEELQVIGGMIVLHGDLREDARFKRLYDKISTALKIENVERFELHDGTDEVKTEALHEFLANSWGGTGSGPEWDGESGGIVIWPDWPIHVSIGDTIVRYENSLGHVVYDVERK